jgi:hypothetical protein
MNILIERADKDGMWTETWRFSARDEHNSIVLKFCTYTREERATKRHKMRTTRTWECYLNTFNRTASKPELPPDVLAEARSRVVDSIQIDV